MHTPLYFTANSANTSVIITLNSHSYKPFLDLSHDLAKPNFTWSLLLL